MQNGEIEKIREQYLNGLWPQFLEEMVITGIHGFSGETISFNFPVTVIVGENGSGKSTILKAASCCYDNNDKQKHYYPSKLFLETPWDTFHDVKFTYRIKQGDKKTTLSISKQTKRWYYPETKYKRPVYIFDISRTLPLDATAGYAKLAKQAVSEISSQALTEDYLTYLKHILSRDYSASRFVVPNVDKTKHVGLLSFAAGTEISQFHQGAGEDTTQDLLDALQGIPNYSLILIDELEASLHPRAQRRLVHFLLWLSRQKRSQIIITTHRSAIFEELPKEARILLLQNNNENSTISRKNIIYGASSEFALAQVEDEYPPALTVFVEDFESQILLREIIRNSERGQDILQLIHIQPVGPANVVQLLGSLAAANKLPYKALACLDGDCDQADGCFLLPGSEAPERVVLDTLKKARWDRLDERFGIGAGTLYTHLNDAITDPDHHNWTKHIGDKVKMSSGEVWELLANEWCKKYLHKAEQEKILEKITEKLNGSLLKNIKLTNTP
jgi:predicted ATPase